MPANTENLEAVPLASTSPIARSEGKGLDLEQAKLFAEILTNVAPPRKLYS
jgi:hypothetical protein